MPLNDFRQVCFVYCLERQADGLYLARNREYLPLGMTDRGCDRTVGPRWKISKALAQKLSWKPLEDLKTIWLYNDGSVPTSSPKHWAAYQAKLKLLAGLKAVNP